MFLGGEWWVGVDPTPHFGNFTVNWNKIEFSRVGGGVRTSPFLPTSLPTSRSAHVTSNVTTKNSLCNTDIFHFNYIPKKCPFYYTLYLIWPFSINGIYELWQFFYKWWYIGIVSHSYHYKERETSGLIGGHLSYTCIYCFHMLNGLRLWYTSLIIMISHFITLYSNIYIHVLLK